MGLSIRAYARRRGVSHVAVMKAIKTGRIEVEADGTIDPAKADAAWAGSTLPNKSHAGESDLKPVADIAVGSVRETLKEQGLPASGNITFVQARTAHEIAKAHQRQIFYRVYGRSNGIWSRQKPKPIRLRDWQVFRAETGKWHG